LKRDYHWFVKTIDTEIAAQAYQQVMMNEHRALIDKLQQDKRKLEDKVRSKSEAVGWGRIQYETQYYEIMDFRG